MSDGKVSISRIYEAGNIVFREGGSSFLVITSSCFSVDPTEVLHVCLLLDDGTRNSFTLTGPLRRPPINTWTIVPRHDVVWMMNTETWDAIVDEIPVHSSEKLAYDDPMRGDS